MEILIGGNGVRLRKLQKYEEKNLGLEGLNLGEMLILILNWIIGFL